jgi:hypothetical protein
MEEAMGEGGSGFQLAKVKKGKKGSAGKVVSNGVVK